MGRRRGGGIRGVVANANQAINEARLTIGDVARLIGEILDGCDIAVVRRGKGSIWDFITGKIDECPFVLRFEPRGEDDEDDEVQSEVPQQNT